MAKDYGVEVDRVKSAIPADELAKDIAVGKAIDFIKENAVITEKAEEKSEEKAEEKPAAKKTAAKKDRCKENRGKISRITEYN